MKRLCVFVIFDNQGKVYDYVDYYLKEMKTIASKIVVVSNEKLSEEGKSILRKYSTHIWERKNEGYDAAAYKEVFEKYLTYEEISEYDELILSNDTCFGPFVSFESIFEKMQNESCDFWGMSYIDMGFLSHLQSNFLVFRKKIFRELMDYFYRLSDIHVIEDAGAKFEIGLFHYFKCKGYHFSYYTNLGTLDIYMYPDIALEQKKFPFLKKRSFKTPIFKKNCSKALSIVEELYGYDVNMIRQYIEEKYGYLEDFADEVLGHKEESILNFEVKPEKEVVHFLNRNEKIYIYGAGYYGRIVAWLYRDCKNIKGFVVSHKEKNDKRIDDLTVYEISEIQDKSVAIIIALNKKNTLQVKEKLIEFPNVFSIWKDI